MGKFHDDLSDRENLITMIDACDIVLSYIHGMTQNDFLLDRKTRDACLAQWSVIGERAAKMSDQLRANHQEVPWTLIVGFKNRGSHSYGTHHFDVSMLWDTVANDTPKIRKSLAQILESIPKP